MKKLALLALAILGLTACEATRSYKDGTSLTLKLSPSPEAQKEAVDRGADALRGFRK